MHGACYLLMTCISEQLEIVKDNLCTLCNYFPIINFDNLNFHETLEFYYDCRLWEIQYTYTCRDTSA